MIEEPVCHSHPSDMQKVSEGYILFISFCDLHIIHTARIMMYYVWMPLWYQWYLYKDIDRKALMTRIKMKCWERTTCKSLCASAASSGFANKTSPHLHVFDPVCKWKSAGNTMRPSATSHNRPQQGTTRHNKAQASHETGLFGPSAWAISVQSSQAPQRLETSSFSGAIAVISGCRSH